LVVASILALTPITTHADQLLVPEQYATIQAALDVATQSDVVSVAPGLYFENVQVRSDRVTLLSRERYAATIDGGADHHTVICNNVTCTIDGFTITNARTATGSRPSGFRIS